MKSAYQIFMDFQAAEAVVRELRLIAKSARELATEDLNSALNGIGNSWKGENSEEYLRKARAITQNVTKTAANIEKIADTVERVAKNTYEAEMEARRIALMKGSGGGGGSS